MRRCETFWDSSCRTLAGRQAALVQPGSRTEYRHMFGGRRSLIGLASTAATALWLAAVPLISAASVVDTFRVGLSPTDAGVNTATSFAYVTNWGGASVSVVDTTQNTVIKTIAVGLHPIT